MSNFTGSALNGFTQGMRLSNQDDRIEEKHGWAKDEHEWNKRRQSALNTRLGFENENLRQGIEDRSKRIQAFYSETGKSPSEAEGVEIANAFNTGKQRRSAIEGFAKKQGTTVGGMQADEDITKWKTQKYNQDKATIGRALQGAMLTNDYGAFVDALGSTFHGTTPSGEGKKYTYEQDGNRLVIRHPAKDNKVVWSFEAPEGGTLFDAVAGTFAQAFQDEGSYFGNAADMDKAKKLARFNQKIALENKKQDHIYRKDEITHAQNAKGKKEKVIALPTADGKGERLTFKEARSQLNDLGKYLKSKSSDQGLAAIFTAMQGGQVNPEDIFSSNEGEMAIERIEEIAKNSPDGRARSYASRFLTIVDAMYGGPSKPALNFDSFNRNNPLPAEPVRKKFNPQTGGFD